MHAIVSSPGVLGIVVESRRSSPRGSGFSTGVTPTDPTPWTLECPRRGSRPAPGRPSMPRSMARPPITDVRDPVLWWVIPIVHAKIVRRLGVEPRDPLEIGSRDRRRPRARTGEAVDPVEPGFPTLAVGLEIGRIMDPREIVAFAIPAITAMSLIVGIRYSSAMSVPKKRLRTSLGTLNRTSPSPASG